MSFKHLKLIEPLLKAVSNEGYTTPTPVQAQSIPAILERRDLLGCAQTGTGKTAAFTIPVLQLMHEEQNPEQKRHILHTLILTPTRELAIQIGQSIEAYGRYVDLRHTVVFGGVSQHPQVHAIRNGVDIMVATPGRLLDLMQQGIISLQHIRYFILDEADRMLDMGFVHDVKKIIAKLPAKRQTLFFSATMPAEIRQLAGVLLTNPVKVEVTPPATTVDIINQSVYHVDKGYKQQLLVDILQDESIESVLVFTQMKHAADKLSKALIRAGVNAEAIHGNKSQNARQNALANFKNRKTRVLVATDIAARGIDIDELAYVVNYELPNVPETYVHRIGRTGRAGASGTAISFCDRSEKEFLKDIEKLIRKQVPAVSGHKYEGLVAAPVAKDTMHRQQAHGRQQSGRPQSNGRSHANSKTQTDTRQQSHAVKSAKPGQHRNQSSRQKQTQGQGQSWSW